MPRSYFCRQSSVGGLRSRFVRDRWRFPSSRRSLDDLVGAVGTRVRGTASASRSLSTSRSIASSRLRSWLRSSCATARITGPTRPTTRCFWTSLSADDASTSKTASTRVEDFCACWPPGPLDRETRSSISDRGRETERETRIDSRSMACILLDIDGVLHVSGQAIPGAPEAIAALQRAGHSLRYVSNNSTRPRAGLAEELRGMGFEIDDADLQTTPAAAARELAGKRVLALTMAAVVPDFDGMELVGYDAEAVLVGGCDETLEPNQVFSYMN